MDAARFAVLQCFHAVVLLRPMHVGYAQDDNGRSVKVKFRGRALAGLGAEHLSFFCFNHQFVRAWALLEICEI